MNESQKGLRPSGGANSSENPSADLDALFNFPSLERLFDERDPNALPEMRARLGRTNQDLERVVRQGTKEDADRATHISHAYDLTLHLLDELERRQRETTKVKKS